MTSEQKAKITELRTAGFGYANIANTLGLTKNQVVSFCHRNGLAGEKSTQATKDKPDVGCCKNCGKPIQFLLFRVVFIKDHVLKGYFQNWIV